MYCLKQKFILFLIRNNIKMIKHELNTEEKIKEAARKVFLRKGYKGATSREIASEAGLNVALTNYYFRNKEKLFQIVFKETIEKFLNDIISILNEQIELKEKVRKIIERELLVPASNPNLFAFIYSEIRSNACEYLKELGDKKQEFLEKWSEQINDGIEKHLVRDIDPMSALTITMGHMHFPIMASSLLKEIGNFDDESYKDFLYKQKEYAIEMINNFLFPNSKT